MAGLFSNIQNGFMNPETGKKLGFMDGLGLGADDPNRYGRMAMLGNAVTVGDPGNFMEGAPQAFALGHDIQRQKEQDQLAQQEREQQGMDRQTLVDHALSVVPPKYQSLARSQPELAMKFAQQEQQGMAADAETQAMFEYVDENMPNMSSFARATPGTMQKVLEQQGVKLAGGGDKQPADVQEYQFYADQARASGQEPLSWLDYNTALKQAGATSITTNVGSEYGTIPQGYELFKDPVTGATSMQPIAGGPEDTTKHEALKFEQERQKATVARQAISNIRAKIDNGGLFDLPEVGVWGSKLAGMNQEATDVRNNLATLQSIVSFDRLQAMRDASPTGGALGAVSERELALLQASLGALSQDSSEEQMRQTLEFIDGIMAKFEAYPDVNGAPTQQAGSGLNDLKSKYGLE
ncbi:hypothetical protein [Maritalea porphyrae]|uniref:hypothetical protein n=1 Tax=Maritalea porphyrae TaxID=880732 RepID=UPI0022AF29F0|nr:hypothetical protein [Maritalea porphyrae]MCZ4270887.1 hypothetical protein [Maritalea porphyrae]